MKVIILILLGMCAGIISILLVPAFAISAPLQGLGIEISKSCLLSDHCLKYQDIIYLDNSSQKQVGNFVPYHGDLARVYTPKQNNPEWLRFHDYTILVDPPSKFPDRVKMIYVVPQLDEFHLKGQYSISEYVPNKLDNFTKAQQSLRQYTKDRYVDSCRIAIITAKNWQVILPDTISYLSHNCDARYTKIQTNMTDIKPITKHDISTSAKAKLESYYDYVKKNCIQKRNTCTDINNRAVTTMRDTK